MSYESASKLLCEFKPLVEERGDQFVALTFEEARARYPDKIAECRRLARQVAEEVGKVSTR